MSSSSLIRALTLHGNESPENLAELKVYKKEALVSIAEGKGGQIVSGSGNGLSFSLAVGKISNVDWFEALVFTIRAIERKTLRGKSRAKF